MRTAGANRAKEYALVVGVMLAVSTCGLLLVPYLGYLAIGVLYLMAVVALSLHVGRWPVLGAGLISALAWDYLFIPPVHEFGIVKGEDRVLFGLNVGVSLVAGQLMAKVQNQARNEKLRKERATALLRISQVMGAAPNLAEGLVAALREIDKLLCGQSTLCLSGDKGVAQARFFGATSDDDSETGFMDSARRDSNAGGSNGTSSNAGALFVPVLGEGSVSGVLAVRPKPGTELSAFERESVEAFASQLGLSIERDSMRSLREREKLLAESDKLHRVLFDAVSHELKSPLTALSIIAENIGHTDGDMRNAMANEMRVATRRLRRLVNNLLNQARLESGALRPKLDWCNAVDVVNASVENVSDFMDRHALEVSVRGGLQLVQMDAALMEHVLSNLLLNAALHTPDGTQISLRVEIESDEKRISFAVADRGPGLAPEMQYKLFKKFERADGARPGGLGLGLSIARGFMAAQGGEIVPGQNPGGGALFTAYLPYAPVDELVDEEICGAEPFLKFDLSKHL